MRRILLVIIGLLILLICLVSIGGLYLFANRALALLAPPPTATLLPFPTPPPNFGTVVSTPAPTVVIPTVAATSTPQLTNSTLDQLLSINVQRDDPLSLTERLKHQSGSFATPTAPTLHKVGDQLNFWVSRDITGTYKLITATLHYVTPHAYIWLENGENASDSGLKAAGDAFENKVYPTDRKNFGSEWTPGIDDDPHVYILNTYFNGAIGYFSSADEYPTFVNRFSNQHELFYMNVHAIRPGTEEYTSVLAHEFTHMIHWNENKHEGSWVTEGFGDLGMKLNGYPQDVSGYVDNPDLQLNAWSQAGQAIPHYEEAYLFLSYLLNRFGDSFIHDLIDSGTHDLFTIQKALDKNAPGLKVDDVFADWTVATFLGNNALGPRYSYLDHSLNVRPQTLYSNYPTSGSGSVHQYGTQYVELDSVGKDVTFNFSGSPTVSVIPTTPHSGRFMWWGNRVDQSDTTLTREFDLSSVSKATLQFWTWYDLEAGFDYAYVEASTDGGKAWTPLAGNTTTKDDPNGANYGNGLTCKSVSGCADDAPPAQWVQEQMDLSPYAGKKILLRFEYITDAIYSGPGIAVDDISIPEINFNDNAESSDNGWQAQGFARIDNTLPQRFIVQAIEYSANDQPAKIVPIALDPSNHASFTTSGFGKGISRIVIAISGDTPITWETASYTYQIQ